MFSRCVILPLIVISIAAIPYSPCRADARSIDLSPSGEGHWNGRLGTKPTESNDNTSWLTINVEKPDVFAISFFLTYEPQTGKCRHINLARALEIGQISQDSAFSVDYRMPTDSKKSTVRIPLDRYLPGDCGWHPTAFGYSVTDKRLPEDKHPLLSRLLVYEDGVADETVTLECQNRTNVEGKKVHEVYLFCKYPVGEYQPRGLSSEGAKINFRLTIAPTYPN